LGKVVATGSTKAKPGPSLLVALVILGVGALLAVAGGVFLGVRALRVIDTRSVTTPGTTQRRLTTGTWIVYQRTGTTEGGTGFTFGDNSSPDLQPGQVTVTGPDGTQLAVQFASEDDTISHNTKVFTSAVQFSVPSTGVYVISFNTPDSGEVIVARSLGSTFRSVGGALSALGLGALLVLTGLTLLFVGIFRRQRAARPAAGAGAGWSPGWSPGPPPPAWSPGPPPPGWSPPPPQQQAPAPAPGWYPDPQAPGTQRWWDGARWTEHRG